MSKASQAQMDAQTPGAPGSSNGSPKGRGGKKQSLPLRRELPQAPARGNKVARKATPATPPSKQSARKREAAPPKKSPAQKAEPAAAPAVIPAGADVADLADLAMVIIGKPEQPTDDVETTAASVAETMPAPISAPGTAPAAPVVEFSATPPPVSPSLPLVTPAMHDSAAVQLPQESGTGVRVNETLGQQPPAHSPPTQPVLPTQRWTPPPEPEAPPAMSEPARLPTIRSIPQEEPLAKPPQPLSASPTTPAQTIPIAPTEPPAHPRDEQQPLLFEIAWEVCWQLGGIYTVLRSKAATMLARWGDRYCLIGPYNPNTAAVEFEEQPTEGYIRTTLDKLRNSGIHAHYGRWLIPGRPRVILLDYRDRYQSLGSDKYFVWKDHGITIDPSDGETNEVVAFGFTVAEFFRILCETVTDRRILAHFHEWMGGMAVPRIAHLRLPMATVFTTHATLLGRYIAGDSPEFYNHLPFIDPDFEAKKYLIYPRFQIERAAAHASTVFTTVSDVTATEAAKLLGRAPDGILPNGINIQRFAALHEFQNLHRQYKERIHEFVMGHFFPSYSFDLDNTLYFVTSGRYEYRNKGMDMYIEALWRLNQRLKALSDRPTVVAFNITRAPTKNVNVGVLQNQSMFEELRGTCRDVQEQMGRRLFEAVVRGRMPMPQELLGDDAGVRLKRAMHAWRSGRQPAIVTHDLMDDAGDPVLQHLRHRGMFNSADDPVKMVFHPQFVTATSPLINLDYEQFVRGCHMGIFPSYYEPWGYTPMECVALGVPAVTTDLSGFGAYVERHVPDNEEQGILVLNRRTKSFAQSADDLAEFLFRFCQLNRRRRIELRNKVERLSELFDWSNLIKHYHEAHDMALDRVGARHVGKLELRLV